ncbi:hypothetical protein LXL04_022792 [Taraxacum kok-saghyz]
MASAAVRRLFIILTLLPVITHSIPFVVFHGVADSCTKKGVKHFTDLLSEWSNSTGYCIEIGNGVWDSWFMPFDQQTDIACETVKSMSELSEGYNIVGLSQGNIVGRGVLEFCDGAPPVKNFISVAGPHAGEASMPFCGSGLMCVVFDSLMKLAIYSETLQEHLAPSNYIKIPTDLDEYREGCKFLPKLNNEFEKNATYKERFSSLQNLVLIMGDKDSVLVPKETSWFGYFPDGAWEPILPAQETRLYIEDWIGLRTLDEAGRVKFVNVTGGHLDITDDDMKKYMVPYLVDEEALKNPIPVKSESESELDSDSMSFMRKLGGQQDLQLNVMHRTEIACEKVKSMSELSEGYNIVGLSQGNIVGRGVLEFCDGAPPVRNFISLGGPHAGEASMPFCGSGLMCVVFDSLMKLAIYSETLQEHLAPSNYIKIPTDLDEYREGCKFLPKLNNEFEKNLTYKERFSSLQNLVLIMGDKDSVLVPKETSWFGYFPDGAWEPILPAQETRLYIEDWIGLRTLDEAGRVKFVNVTGGHLDITDDDMKKYMVPYLVDEETLKNPIPMESELDSDSMSFMRKLGGQQDLQLNSLM